MRTDIFPYLKIGPAGMAAAILAWSILLIPDILLARMIPSRLHDEEAISRIREAVWSPETRNRIREFDFTEAEARKIQGVFSDFDTLTAMNDYQGPESNRLISDRMRKSADRLIDRPLSEKLRMKADRYSRLDENKSETERLMALGMTKTNAELAASRLEARNWEPSRRPPLNHDIPDSDFAVFFLVLGYVAIIALVVYLNILFFSPFSAAMVVKPPF